MGGLCFINRIRSANPDIRQAEAVVDPQAFEACFCRSSEGSDGEHARRTTTLGWGARFEESGGLDERLFAALYAELRRLADSKLRQYPGMTVSPTTLVQEDYVNPAGRENARFTDRGKFLSYAARAMRGPLIDFARRRQALKRGAGLEITRLDTQIDAEPEV